MPYKDPERKRQGERIHRSERLARRRELRQAEAARTDAQPDALRLQIEASSLLLPLAAGGALAAYNPKLAIGAGGLTLAAAALYKKDWSWWIVGIFILALAFFNGMIRMKRNDPIFKFRKPTSNFAGRAKWNYPQRIFRSHQLAFDRVKRSSSSRSNTNESLQ
jgi:hypothetical protein